MQKFVLKAKNTLKRVAAISTGVAMLGATALGAVAAADLADYPEPFVQDGEWNTLLVLGTGGTNPAGLASDLAGAVDIAARLAQEAKSVSSTGTTVTGAKTEEVDLDASDLTVDFGSTLTDSKISGLADSQLTWNDETIDYEEVITVVGFAPKISEDDEDFGATVYLGTDGTEADNTIYWATTDGDMDISDINTTDPLKINLLGKSIEITALTTTSATMNLGTETVLGVGETYTFEGEDVEITSVGQSSVAVKVGTVTKFLAENENYDFGDIKVQIENILYTDDIASRQVQLTIGSDVTKTVNDGDSLEFFGEPADESDAAWLWYISAADANVKIGAKMNQEMENEDDDLIEMGETYYFPNEYGYISFDSLNVEADMKITGAFDDVTVVRNEAGLTIDVDHTHALHLKTNKDGEGFQVNDSGTWEDTDEIWLIDYSDKWAAAYRNSDNRIEYFVNSSDEDPILEATEMRIVYDDTTIGIYTDELNATGSDNIVFADFEDTGEDLTIDAEIDAAQLGAVAEDADAAELTLTGGSTVGAKDESWRVPWGNIIETPENNGDKDEFVLWIAPEQIKANIIVGGPAATSVASGDSYTLNSISGVPLVKLDTEIADKTAQPVILVGGPAVNRLTAEALGLTYPAHGESSTIPTNKAMLKLIDNAFGGTNVALVVAGWESVNTREAATILKDYDEHSLSGTQVSVSGTTITPITEETTTE